MSHYSLVDELKDIHGENVSSQLATNYHVALEAYLQAQEGCDLFCKDMTMTTNHIKHVIDHKYNTNITQYNTRCGHLRAASMYFLSPGPINPLALNLQAISSVITATMNPNTWKAKVNQHQWIQKIPLRPG